MSRRGARGVDGSDPSTDAGERSRAFELKFLLDASTAQRLRAWAIAHLTASPHVASMPDHASVASTMYLDCAQLTPTQQASRKSKSKSKYRIRRNGDSTLLQVERSRSRGEMVATRACTIELAELACMRDAGNPTPWSGQWFHRRVQRLGLAPAAVVRYRRASYFADGDSGSCTFTLDDEIYAQPHSMWTWPNTDGSRRILESSTILELSFAAALPRLFKKFLAEFPQQPTPLSKYRAARDSFRRATLNDSNE